MIIMLTLSQHNCPCPTCFLFLYVLSVVPVVHHDLIESERRLWCGIKRQDSRGSDSDDVTLSKCCVTVVWKRTNGVIWPRRLLSITEERCSLSSHGSCSAPAPNTLAVSVFNCAPPEGRWCHRCILTVSSWAFCELGEALPTAAVAAPQNILDL